MSHCLWQKRDCIFSEFLPPENVVLQFLSVSICISYFTPFILKCFVIKVGVAFTWPLIFESADIVYG